MRNTEKEIKRTFLNLLKTHDIESIDVMMICNALNIKRQSFYYHYKNIYDVIYSMFDEADLEIDEETDFDTIIINLISYLFEHEEFNQEILKSSAKDILEEFAFSYLYRSLNKYLEIYTLRVDATKDLGRFLAKGISYQILYYFGHADYSKDEIYQKINYLINKDIIDYIVKNYKDIKNVR